MNDVKICLKYFFSSELCITQKNFKPEKSLKSLMLKFFILYRKKNTYTHIDIYKLLAGMHVFWFGLYKDNLHLYQCKINYFLYFILFFFWKFIWITQGDLEADLWANLIPVSQFYPWIKKKKKSSSGIHWEQNKCKLWAGCDPYPHYFIRLWIKVTFSLTYYTEPEELALMGLSLPPHTCHSAPIPHFSPFDVHAAALQTGSWTWSSLKYKYKRKQNYQFLYGSY